MELELFRKNVMKAHLVKPAKLGMRYASKNSVRTATTRGAVALRYASGNLLHALGPYILGMQFNQEMKSAALIAMGDVGAELVYLGKILKVKIPTATKKVKLSGTRTAALLQLDMLVNDILGQIDQGVFCGPKMCYVKKEVVMPTKGGAKEMRDVEVIDREAEGEAEKARTSNLRSLLESAVDLYWRLCYDMFKDTPAKVFDNKVDRLKSEFPKVEFEQAGVSEEKALGVH
jgi:hypothetical protein